MSNEKQEQNENQDRDIRLPKNEMTKEEQREKVLRNTEKEYEAESPADPYQEPSEEITDRAQDNIDIAGNDIEKKQDPLD